MLTTFVNALLSADADAVWGADYRSVPEDRTNRRNGYRHHDFYTRAGTIDGDPDAAPG
jgi:transposase-like protein